MATYGTDWNPVTCGRCCAGEVEALGGECDDKWECNSCGAIYDTKEDGYNGELSEDYPETDNSIQPGDRVKSYHIPDCPERGFVIGTVLSAGKHTVHGCLRYEIQADLDCRPSRNKPYRRYREVIYPPLNGTRNNFNEIINGVVKIDDDEYAKHINAFGDGE